MSTLTVTNITNVSQINVGSTSVTGESITVGNSIINTSAIAVGNSTVNTSVTSASLNVGNSSITTSDITVGNTIVANSTNISLRTSNIERFRVATDGSFTSVIPSGSTLLPTFMCRAWVNFDGTTSPGTIRGNGNVSSVTKNGTGSYTVNFTTAMPDANYLVVGAGSNNTEGFPMSQHVAAASPTTSSVRVWSKAPGVALQDVIYANISIFR